MEYKSFMEALKGKQHKIDKNKNGKVDSNDFELLRKEATELDSPSRHAEHIAAADTDDEAKKRIAKVPTKHLQSAHHWNLGYSGGEHKYNKHVKSELQKRGALLSPAESSKRFDEEIQLEEATVKTQKYEWGTMKTVHHGSDFSIPLHPEHHQEIAKLKDQQEHKFKTEDGKHWTAKRSGDDVHFQGANGGNSTTVKHSTMSESVEELDEIRRMKTKLNKLDDVSNKSVARQKLSNLMKSGKARGALIANKMRTLNMGDDIDQEDLDALHEVMSKDAKAGDWIHDFVHSDNPKFSGKNKKERINMALGAYYDANKKKDGVSEQAPVAPVPDRKYIKGTPENKAYKATKKPINGHPTNVKEEAEEIEERNKENALMRKTMDASRGARYKLNNPVPDADPKHKTARDHNVAIGRALRNEDKMTTQKDKNGKLISFKYEGDWKKSTEKKQGSGKAANLAGQAMQKMSKANEEVEVLDELHPLTYMSYHNKATAIGRDGTKAFDKSGKDRSANIEKADKRVTDSAHKRGPLAKLYPTDKKSTLGKKAQAAIRSNAQWNEEVEELEEGDLSIRHLYNKFADAHVGGHDTKPTEKAIRKVHGDEVFKHMKKAATANAKGDMDGEEKHFDNAQTAGRKTDRIGGTVGRGRSEFMRKRREWSEEVKKDEGEYDQEGDMAKTQLRSIKYHADELHEMLSDNDNLPEWVQSKLTLAQDYLQTVCDYMYSKDEVNEEKKSVEVKVNAAGDAPHEEKWEAVKKIKKPVKESFDDEGNLISNKVSYKEFMLEYTPGPGGVTQIKGRSYGANYSDPEGADDADDNKPMKPAAEKRGRGRPAGAKSGARKITGTSKLMNK
jgi:hypothetical protein